MMFPPGYERFTVTAITYNVGRGVDGDPIRNAITYYRDDGTIVATVDEWADEQRRTNPVHR